jgi:predicted GH43/DUF377 family glycosyl hydrolase
LTPDYTEMLFDQSIKETIEQVQSLQNVEIVIGIPFYNETETLMEVLHLIDTELADLLAAHQAIFLCVGDPAGRETLEIIRQASLSTPLLGLTLKAGVNGRGSSVRAIMEITRRLEANLVILAADLARENSRGFQTTWVRRLLESIQGEYDLAVGVFERHYTEDVIASLFVTPFLEIFYNHHFNDPLSGIYAMSHDLVEDYSLEIKFCPEITLGYGIDPWLLTRAIIWKKNICQIELGSKLSPPGLEKLNYLFKDLAAALFACIDNDYEYWSATPVMTRTPDVLGDDLIDQPIPANYTLENVLQAFRHIAPQYRELYEKILPYEVSQVLIHIISQPSRKWASHHLQHYDSKTWARIVFEFLINYRYNPALRKDDVLNALTFAFNGRLAAMMSRIEMISTAEPEASLALARLISEQQRDSFLVQYLGFKQNWLAKADEHKPALIPAHYLEFIPGVPIILPKKITGRGGKVVWTEGVFSELHNNYRAAFNHFMTNGLLVPEHSQPLVYSLQLEKFFHEVEEALQSWLPGDLYTESGVEEAAANIFNMMSLPKMFSVKDEILEEMLLRFPPLNVMIPLGYNTAKDLVANMNVRDATSLANLVENRKYVDRALFWILDHLLPENMTEVELKPLILGSKTLDGMAPQNAPSNLNKITTRITITPMTKGMGGEFPRMRFCLYLIRQIMIALDYAALWRVYAREKKNLGVKVRNSLIGRYHTDIFSAHNIFENMHHRAMVAAFRKQAELMLEKGRKEDAEMLNLVVDSYGLSQVLEDGSFIPCSAWTWASYSYRGGKGVPTPLSSHVEEKWFNHDLLEAIQLGMGYDIDQIEHLVTQLIGEGRASENILDIIVGAKTMDVSVVPQEVTAYPPAGQLKRYPQNPILIPLREHRWESRYVLNTAALRINDKVYLFYRAFGDDEISRIGLAITDGYRVLERMPDPIFSPLYEHEKKGCEDPRVVIIGEDIYMLYTAYDGEIAQIAAASIGLQDFLERRFDRWHRIGLAFDGIWDKDAILFPEKINNKYVIYHRIEPSVWVSYLDELVFPAPKESHSIILGPRSGRMWDSLKIGAGTQPIKTVYGWLMIYHGVDHNRVYRLGVMLVDYHNPERLLYRSPNPVLSPELEFEVGDEDCWVPNVVFTCGAVAAQDKETLEAEDELLVYYGAADTYIGLATAKVGDLIPESIRLSIKKA